MTTFGISDAVFKLNLNEAVACSWLVLSLCQDFMQIGGHISPLV